MSKKFHNFYFSIVLFFLIIFIFSTSSIAMTESECSPKDFSQAPGLEKPLSRGDTGWCYAYATADLVSYKVQKRVSAFYIAAQFHNERNNSLWKKMTTSKTDHFIYLGGNMESSLDSINGKAVCSEKDIPSDFYKIKLKEYSDVIENLNKFHTPEKVCSQAKSIFPGIDSQVMKEILLKYEGEERMIELAINSCTDRIQIPKFKTIIKSIKKDPELKSIDEQLNNNNIVSFAHDMSFYSAGNRIPKQKANHEATIVGRKWNQSTGQCEYKVRGSSGDLKNYKYASPYKENNAGGYVWVDKETLKKYTEEVTYLE